MQSMNQDLITPKLFIAQVVLANKITDMARAVTRKKRNSRPQQVLMPNYGLSETLKTSTIPKSTASPLFFVSRTPLNWYASICS